MRSALLTAVIVLVSALVIGYKLPWLLSLADEVPGAYTEIEAERQRMSESSYAALCRRNTMARTGENNVVADCND